MKVMKLWSASPTLPRPIVARSAFVGLFPNSFMSWMVRVVPRTRPGHQDQPFGAALGNVLAIAVIVLLVIAWRAGARDEARA